MSSCVMGSSLLERVAKSRVLGGAQGSLSWTMVPAGDVASHG